MSRYEFDVAILGGGSAGYAAARTAAGAGLRTVVVEGGREVGGLCILRGCMPTKALLQAGEVRHLIQRAALWGMRPGSVGFDWSAVLGRKDELIEEFAAFRRQQLSDGRFEFVRAHAVFADPHTVKLDTGNDLSAAHWVISTGSTISQPPVPGLPEAGYWTSDDAQALEKPPESLIVLGGGPVALEFAQFFARFGTHVTVIQRSGQVLRDSDADVAAALEGAFEREGIRIYRGTRLIGAGKDRFRWVEFEQGGKRIRVEAEAVLHGLGRVPNTAGLNLAAAGVGTEGARIVTDLTQRTSAQHIYAAGDCTGPYEIVHIAIQQGEVAAHNIAGAAPPRQVEYRLLLSVVFTEPQVAQVGLTEKAARAGNVAYRAATYPFDDHGKSLILGATDGFVKLLADPFTGEIVGGACVGPLAGELIHEIVVAMAGRMTINELARLPHYHPTLAEIWTYPAEELAATIPL
jgi:pyruvate/2-oxoglutarate dehydrogenase complex dihydrolipoamide dehydrogenase (E3) component